MAEYGDGTLYGDGTKYFSNESVPFEYVVEEEVQCHRLSARINYEAEIIPGTFEAFRIHDIRPRVAPNSQKSFTYESFVDGTTPSERISCRINYSTDGTDDFLIYHMQIVASTKKHQPKG